MLSTRQSSYTPTTNVHLFNESVLHRLQVQFEFWARKSENCVFQLIAMRLPHWTFALFLGLQHCWATVEYSLSSSNVLAAMSKSFIGLNSNDSCSQDLKALAKALMKREMWAMQSKFYSTLFIAKALSKVFCCLYEENDLLCTFYQFI